MILKFQIVRIHNVDQVENLQMLQNDFVDNFQMLPEDFLENLKMLPEDFVENLKMLPDDFVENGGDLKALLLKGKKLLKQYFEI